MIVLVAFVFLALAVGALTTDLPLVQRLLGAYLFLSVGVVAAGLTASGLRLLLGRGSRLHVSSTPDATQIRLGRPAPTWQAGALTLWALGWWAVAVRLLVGGPTSGTSTVTRIVEAVLAALFGAALLVGARERWRHRADVPVLGLRPTGLAVDGRWYPWAGVRVERPGGHRPGRAARSALLVGTPDGDVVVATPGPGERDRLITELHAVLVDPALRATTASARYAADLATRLAARH